MPARAVLARLRRIEADKREFLARFCSRNRRKLESPFSGVKNQPNSQISIDDKRLTANEKTLFEQNASSKCQKCEYLTLLRTFARDKCCD
jgi:hypothetical protein